MSVLIQYMEMPTSCRECWLKMNCDDCEGWECVCVPLHQQIGYLSDLLADKRRNDCPLVPVPPHGRLIDADALYREIKAECNPYGKPSIGYDDGLKVLGIIGSTPPVIPAEEKELCQQSE